jgi:NAD(P)-dependent dehydrogenase (short-subunit alcohol dehydrogenase family)
MSKLCEGRVAIVTGAGRGIGREYALMLAEHGAKVVVNDLGAAADGQGADLSPAAQVVAEIEAAGGEAVADGENVADFQGARRLVEHAIAAFGYLDILVNNAGILRDRMLVNMEEDEWDAVIAVHMKGHFAVTRHAAAHWRERAKAGEQLRARVINTSSPSGVFGNVGQTNYGAAKAGIIGFTKSLARELGSRGVRANVVAPGYVKTRLTDAIPQELQSGMLANTPLGRLGDPEDVAGAVRFLCSDEASFITGEVLLVDGGLGM